MKLKKAGIFTKIIILVLLAYAVVSLITLRAKIEDARAEQLVLQQAIEDKTASNAEMQYAIENSDSDSVKEDIAREKLDLVLPDEQIFYAE